MTLKREQESAIRHVYGGNDVFVWLPTGFGKSIVYECLPFLYDHKLGHLEGFSVVLVLSPLVSLLLQLKLMEISRENLRACANCQYQASPAQSAWTSPYECFSSLVVSVIRNKHSKGTIYLPREDPHGQATSVLNVHCNRSRKKVL